MMGIGVTQPMATRLWSPTGSLTFYVFAIMDNGVDMFTEAGFSPLVTMMAQLCSRR